MSYLFPRASLVLWIILSLGYGAAEKSEAQNRDTPQPAMEDRKDEELKEAQERVEKEQRFSTLREQRRDILQRIPVAKTLLEKAQADLAGLKTERAQVESVLDSIALDDDVKSEESRLQSLQERLKELRGRGKAEGQSDEEFEEEVGSIGNEADFLEMRISRARVMESQRVKAEQRLKEIDEKLPILEKEVATSQAALDALQAEQFLVEDKINVLLIPENARNEFKLYITAAFSALVALVILGFFIVAAVDESVRRAIFSNQAGIQFLTLFSLVIAIILFGITDTLQAKELSALLGGISGYILGRVSDRAPASLSNQNSGGGEGG